MLPYTLIDSATEHGVTLKLYRHGDNYSIRVDGEGQLMGSHLHHSEEALAELACDHVDGIAAPRLLIGGLGIGFTLAAALARCSVDATVVVSELMPAVVRWNRRYLGSISGFPLKDERVQVVEQDVGRVMRQNAGKFDAIMLDVDNGPDGFTRDDNDNLYGLKGVNNAYAALKPGGVLTVWSAFRDQAFTQRLVKVGFRVTEHTVRARSKKRGSRHTIWVAVR